MDKCLAERPLHGAARSLVSIAVDGLAVFVAIRATALVEGHLHAASGPLSVPDDLVMLLIAMLACFAWLGRYNDPIRSSQSRWKLVGLASFCVAAAEGATGLLIRGSADQELLLAVFPVFPVLAVLSREVAERLLTSGPSTTESAADDFDAADPLRHDRADGRPRGS